MDTALQMLLKKIASERTAPLPEPAAPVGNLGPLSNDTSLAFRAQNPEPVPPAYTQPAAPDMNFVNQYAGVAPERPVQRDPSFLEKLSTVLLGVGAGLEGRGPQFVESVRARREEPIRRYEAEQRVFEDRRARGFELAERRAEREADALHRANQASYETQYREWLRKNDVRDDAAKQRMAQAFTLERDARARLIEEDREQRRELRARQDDARSIAARYGTGPGAAPPAVAKEIGEYIANIRDGLSPVAARWWNAQTRRTGVSPSRAGGPSKAAMEALQRFELSKQGLAGALQRGDNKSAAAFREAMNRNYKSLARYPGDIELSTTDPNWPFARLRNAPAPTAAPAGAQPQQQADPLGLFK